MNKCRMRHSQQNARLTFTQVRGDFLQRRCACESTPGLDNECAECSKKRLALQRHPTGQTKPTTMPPILNEVLHSPGRLHVHGIPPWPSSQRLARAFRKDCHR